MGSLKASSLTTGLQKQIQRDEEWDARNIIMTEKCGHKRVGHGKMARRCSRKQPGVVVGSDLRAKFDNVAGNRLSWSLWHSEPAVQPYCARTLNGQWPASFS